MTDAVLPRLTDLHVRLVSKCNLNCDHCYASDWFVRSDVLNPSLVCRAIDEAIPLGLEKVTFTGGEPTLHKDLSSLLLYCVEKGLKSKLETNAVLLRRNDGELINLIIDNKDLVYLYISYDLAKQRGLQQQEHDQIRDVAVELYEHGVDVRLQSSVTEINIDDLDTLVELSRKYGIPQRIFFDHSVLGNGITLNSFDLDTVLGVYHRLKSMNLNLDFELPPLITGDQEQTCGWGLHRCEIMPNGDVTTCAPVTFTQTKFVAGNLNQRSLTEIWRESDYFTGMREVVQSDFQGVCGKCRHWEGCRGSCRAYAWSKGTNWFSPYPLCQSFAERFPDVVKERLYDGDISVPPSEDLIERLPRVKALATTKTLAIIKS